MTDTPLLDASGVAKSFGAVRALTDARLTVQPSEIVALMGANGAGKSTFVKILTGARPDQWPDCRRANPGRADPGDRGTGWIARRGAAVRAGASVSGALADP